MQVKPYDGLTTYLVISDSLDDQGQPKEYLVDVVYYRGIGCCSCPHFSIGLEHTIGRIVPLQLYDQFRCKHIRAVVAYLKEDLFYAFIRNEIAKEKHERPS